MFAVDGKLASLCNGASFCHVYLPSHTLILSNLCEAGRDFAYISHQ
jgi:hypothetical protein